MSKLGRYIRERRNAEGISLRELARRLGVSHVFLGRVERGGNDKVVLLPERHWPALIDAVPSIEVERLEELALLEQDLDWLRGKSDGVRSVAAALARRADDIDDDTATKLLEILKKKKKR